MSKTARARVSSRARLDFLGLDPRMGLGSFLHRLYQRIINGRGYGVQELARRLGLTEDELRAVQPRYREFDIPKRSGGTRRILAPGKDLKDLQRRILRRLLGRLRAHPAATGFERGRSIVINARHHVGCAVVVRMDVKDFFPSIRSDRVHRYFRRIGWNRDAARLLTALCTHEGGLPQGAPTSPRLSNLVNFRLDARLTALAARIRLRNPRTGRRSRSLGLNGLYTRYADDITFSFPVDDPGAIRAVIRVTRIILEREGYTLHLKKKLQIRRRHDRQQVTGLVVNAKVNLPRSTRRWLRAVEHRLAHGGRATLTPEQLAGWHALQAMIARQSEKGTS